MKKYKSPDILRLSRIEKWAKTRLERRLLAKDTAGAMRAASFYTIIARRADGMAVESVSSYQ